VANETLFSTLGDQRVSNVLSGMILMSLAARGSLPAHPALIFGGDINGKATDTLKFPQVGMFGYDLMAPVADGAAGAVTAITDASSTLSPQRYLKAYQASDLARFTDPAGGAINAAMFAADAVATFANQQLYLLSQMGSGFSTTQGSTGVDLGIADHLGARIALEIANVEGPYCAIYHGRQVGDLETAAANASGGAIQWMPATAKQAEGSPNDMYKGNFLNIDIYRSNHVPTANGGADRSGFVFGRGALVWGVSSVRAETADQVTLSPLVLFEQQRAALEGLNLYVMQCYLAFAEAIDAAGTGMRTDA
jgi:hypothetical protein